MIKQLQGFFLLLLVQNAGLAASGNLFQVTSSGTALTSAVSITLCLNINGNSPLSCQNYSVQNTNLTIRTTIPNRTYQYVGLKVNTPNYTFAPGTANALGFIALGTVSATQAASGTMTSTLAATMPFYIYVGSSNANKVFTYGLNSSGQLQNLSIPGVSTATNPQYINVTPNQKYAYVPCFDGGAISMYSINQSSGVLTPLSPSSTSITGPHNVAITPTGSYAYAPSFGSGGTTFMYSITQSTGQLAPLSPSTITAQNAAQYAVVNPAGTYAYVVNVAANTVSMYSINQSTGRLTALSPSTVSTGTNPVFIVIHPTGTYAYIVNSSTSSGGNSVSMYSINQSTGQLTALSPATIATGSQPYSIAMNAAGTFAYVTNRISNTVSMYSINQSTGQLTALSPASIAAGSVPTNIVISSSNYAYVANAGGSSNSTISMYSINQNTGQLTALSPATFTIEGRSAYGLAIINKS